MSTSPPELRKALERLPNEGVTIGPKSASEIDLLSRASKTSKSHTDKSAKKKKKKKSSSKAHTHPSDEHKKPGIHIRDSDNPQAWAHFDDMNDIGWQKDDSAFDSARTPFGMVSDSTPNTEAITPSTIGSAGNIPSLFVTKGVDHNQHEQRPAPNSIAGTPDAVSHYHSEMLHGFLQRNGHDEAIALATAAAFEKFLTQQKYMCDPGNIEGSKEEEEEESRLDALESVIDEATANSFAPDSFWDEASIEEKSEMIERYLRQQELIPNHERRDDKRFDEKAMMIAEYMETQQRRRVEQTSKIELAAFHGENLQSFLRCHGKGDLFATETAVAFQDFLARQHDALKKLSPPTSAPSSRRSSNCSSQRLCSESTATSSKRSIGEEHQVPASGRFIAPSPISENEVDDNPFVVVRMPRHGSMSHAMGETHVGGKAPVVQERHKSMSHINHSPGRCINQSTSSRMSMKENGSSRTLEEQLSTLSVAQLSCFELLRKQAKGHVSDTWCLRFARCADFKANSASKVMKKFNYNYMDLTISTMERSLRTMLLYPVPGVMGRGNIDVFYVKFQRLVPRKTTVQAFAEHLVYVMNCMHERESSYVNGIGLIADLSDFTVSNFSIPFMSKFLMLVQGRQVPVKVESVMFLNPPRWFGAVWGVLKTMMSSDFLKTKVHLISFHELFTRHLNPGAPKFLTNDIYLGQRPANEIVAEFIDERKRIESHKILSGHR